MIKTISYAEFTDSTTKSVFIDFLTAYFTIPKIQRGGNQMKRQFVIFSCFLILVMPVTFSTGLAAQDPCKLVTKEQISNLIKDFGFKKFRYVDGRSYFAGQSCDYFGNGKSLTITVEEKEDFSGDKNIFSSAKEKFDRQKEAAAPGVLHTVKNIGDEAIWDGVSLAFLKNGSIYTIRVRATKGLVGKSQKEREQVNLEYSKAIADMILKKIESNI